MAEETIEDVYGSGQKSDFLATKDIPEGEKLDCKIVAMNKKELGKGEKATTKLIASLESGKSFVINKTNAERLAKNFGTTHYKEWIGKTFILYRSETTYAGQEVDCLRVQKNVE